MNAAMETPFVKLGRVLSARGRKQIKEKNFALPGGRYPIHDKAHARNALARVSQYGTPEEQAKVRAAVAARYPGIGKKAEERLMNTKTAAFCSELLKVGSPRSAARIMRMIEETLVKTAPKRRIPVIKPHKIPGSQRVGNPIGATSGQFMTRFGAGCGLKKSAGPGRLKGPLALGGLGALAYGAYQSQKGSTPSSRPLRRPSPFGNKAKSVADGMTKKRKAVQAKKRNLFPGADTSGNTGVLEGLSSDMAKNDRSIKSTLKQIEGLRR